VDGQPILSKNGGIALERYKYDSAGREIIRRLFDAGGKLVRSTDTGRSIIRTDYDHRNLKIRESSFDEFDKPIDRLDTDWSVEEWVYNPNGQLMSIIYRDRFGRKLSEQKSG
jgi:YD repeat-containing protein